jgi:hypothetical protein
MSKLVTVTLSTGWKLRCRVVPSLALRGIQRKPEHQYPPYPTVEVTTMGGKGTERVPAPDGSPEALEYRRQRHVVDARREEEGERFSYGYGVCSWQAPDSEEWLTDAPEGWELDPMVAAAVAAQDVDTRTAFIMYELLALTSDLVLVQTAIFNREAEPITSEEVDAAEASFPGDVG